MARQNRGEKRHALADTVFPPFVPISMRILSIIAVVVLLTAGVLFISGYFTAENGQKSASVSPTPFYDTVSPADPEEDTDLPQTDISSAPLVADLAGLSLRGGSGTIYAAGDSIVLHVGEAAKIELLADGEPADTESITWKSFDESVFLIDSGTLTAMSAGEAQCRATYSVNNQSISITIIVKEAEISPGTDQTVIISTYKPTENAPATSASTEAPIQEPPAQESPGKLTPVDPFTPSAEDPSSP